jgi:polysaccharide export outer membrane protein
MGLKVVGVGAAILLVLGAAQAAVAAERLPASEVGSQIYRLSTGDKVRITVFNNDRLNGDFVVTGDGNLSYPLIGNVKVSGLTVEETQDLIRSKLAEGYVVDPRVTLEVMNYRPFYIIGEVAKPGEYPYTIGVTAQQAVAMAGGYTYRANKSKMFITRTDTKEYEFNPRHLKVYIQPGDMIRIGERHF